ncbi:3888_t:CDS:10 [Paraglomus occultum]|uniref:Adenylate cyclase n=1 Tax=Paraglomus occultum TaxID=144539 RepID=A0A9N9AAN7_9GLOM|nr:3888_t:CDS:10 [Paraglomus occultum]
MGHFPPPEIAPFAYQTNENLIEHRRLTPIANTSTHDPHRQNKTGGWHRRTKSSDSDPMQLMPDHVKDAQNLVPSMPKEKKGILGRFTRKRSKDKEATPEVRKSSESEHSYVSATNTPAIEKDDPVAGYGRSVSANSHWVKVTIKRKESYKEQGIIDPERSHSIRQICVDDDVPSLDGWRELPPPGGAEGWSPPESWAVRKPSVETVTLVDDEDTREADSDNWYYGKRLFCIRIFRPDATFGTVSCGLNTTTSELCHILGKKFFIADITKYNLYVKRHDLERVLTPQERPLQLQKRLLEQAGYTEVDRLEDLGREDNSYLVRFTFKETIIPRFEEEESLAQFKDVDLQMRNLQTIPIFLYRQAYFIYSLNASRNLMLDLPTDFIQSCTQLGELHLAHNDLDRVPQSVRQSEMLSLLNLSSNRLKDLDHARLDKIRELANLDVENNQLKTLPSLFSHFRALTKLNIANNLFTTLPEVICSIQTLEKLDASFNRISYIPQEIGNLRALEQLYVIGNQITGTLPQTFANLTNLRVLDISHNALQSIDVCAKCPNLECLIAESNNVSIVDLLFPCISRLVLTKNQLTQFSLSETALSLTYLSLTYSKLTSLPDALFEQLRSVERLELCHNQIVYIPKTISNLKNLTRFSCTYNRLGALPPEIGKLSSLRFLDVHNNNLTALPKEIWCCQSLVTINASSNLLETFPAPYLPMPSSPLASPLASPLPSPVPGSRANSLSPTMPVRTQPSPPPTPPLATALRELFLGDNRLTNDIFAIISKFTELRRLNLSFNDIDEIPNGGVFSQHLVELYLSGNQLSALPDDVERWTSLKVLHVNGNKLKSLPADLSKIRKLVVLDAGSNALKYNIANWQYDWNWNWNIDLKYLNLSGNKRFEIRPLHDITPMRDRDRNLANFSTLNKLRVLGLMDVTLLKIPLPDESDNRRVRLSGSEVNCMAYGMADTLGQAEHLSTWEVVIPKFRNSEDECLFGLFDAHSDSSQGSLVTKYLHDWTNFHLVSELDKLRENDTIESALRRAFLSLNKELGAKVFNSNMEREHTLEHERASAPAIDDSKAGASGIFVYIVGTILYVANVGDVVAVISRNGGTAVPIASKHSPLQSQETVRIRTAGGFISHDGCLNGELKVSRSFGHFHLIPIVNSNPSIETVELSEQDEFLILGTRGLWDRMSYQTAVDIARTEKDDLMLAAQKLRDFAISYGAEESIVVMIIGVGDLFDRRLRRRREGRGAWDSMIGEETTIYISSSNKGKRRKEEIPVDSTIARLQKEIAPPTGQVALVFTDIKNSTLLWETVQSAMHPAIKEHNDIMRRQLRNIGGYEVKTEGDAFMVSFPTVFSALLWCFTVQEQLLQADWPKEILDSDECKEVYGGRHNNELLYKGLSVRMGIHWGAPVCEIDPITRRMDYFGPMVNRAARICSAADGGQICVSADVEGEIRLLLNVDDDDETVLRKTDKDGAVLETVQLDETMIKLRKMGFVVKRIGERKLKGLENPEELCLVYPEALKGRLEADQAKEKTYEPATAQILDPVAVRSLGYLCLRLERVASGNVLAARNVRNSRADYLSGLLTFHVKDNADDEELIRICESLVTRIENALSTLYLNKFGPFTKVLEQLSDVIAVDPDHILKALQMYAQVMGVAK